MGEVELWRNFQRWGRVWEIYIPNKKDRWGRRFWFARFFNVPNPSLLEHQLDNLYIGGRKLNVNFPRFEKGNGNTSIDKPGEKVKVKTLGSGR